MAAYFENKKNQMTSTDGIQKNIGDNVWVAGYEGKDTFLKPVLKELKPFFKVFFHDFQNCAEYCKPLNNKTK